MIMVGKLIVTLVWAFWMMAMSTAEGKPSDQDGVSESVKKEYNPRN